MLAGELARHESEEGRAWSRAVKPLGEAFVRRFQSFLPLATYPVRAGVHSNTAFALTLALDYADAVGDVSFATLCREKAKAWYGGDVQCQAWEPSQDDFLSSALTEAGCMSRVLPHGEFAQWFAEFLPHAAKGEPATLFSPARVSDRTDGKIVHLDGLNLSRAWCWRIISNQLDGAPASMQAAIASHIASALSHVTGDYMGEHWLASFALLALDDLPSNGFANGTIPQ
jgi:hypothetical protein